MKCEAKCDRFEINGDYKMEGMITVLPIKGVGKTNTSLTDVTATIDLRGEYFDKNGEIYINITSLKIKMIPKHATFYFENIFNGDKVLSQTINNFMNENSEVVVNTLLPAYETYLSDNFRTISNHIFHNVPMKMIFPE